MSQKSSTFVQETRERETWLTSALERGEADAKEGEQLMATAAVACLQEMSLTRSQPSQVEAPWYLRLGSFMRYVFTLGRRR